MRAIESSSGHLLSDDVSEPSAGRIEWNGIDTAFEARFFALGVFPRGNVAQHVALILVLDPWQFARVEERASDGDDSPREEGLLDLEHAAGDGQGRIASNAALAVDDERSRSMISSAGFRRPVSYTSAAVLPSKEECGVTW